MPDSTTFVQKMMNSLERSIVARPVLSAFLIVGVLFAAVLFNISPVYETNDDVTISMIASGTGVGDRPDEHLIFSHILIGLALKTLYTVAPQISWYGVYSLLVNYLAAVAVLYSLLIWRYSRNAFWCFLFLFAVAGIQLIIRLQFTSTAAWATACGMLLLLTAHCLRADNSGQRTSGLFISGAALMVLGSLVRFESYLAAFAVGAIPSAVVLYRCEWPVIQWKLIRQTVVLVALVQLIVGGLQLANYAYYVSDPQWREFYTLNPYRVKFNDYEWTRFTPETKPVFDRVDWTSNDYTLISKYSFYDEDKVFGCEKIQAIIDAYPWWLTSAKWRQFVPWWMKLARHSLLLPLWALLPIFVWLSRNRLTTFGYLLLFAICLDAVVTGLMLLKSPVYRMYYPLFAFQPLFLLLVVRWNASSITPADVDDTSGQRRSWQQFFQQVGHALVWFLPPKLVGSAAITVAVMASSWSIGKACHLSLKMSELNRELRQMITKIEPRDDELYVCWVGCFPFEAIRPLDSPLMLQNLHLLGLGWTQKTPINAAVKSRFHIQNSVTDTRDAEKVFYFSTSVINSIYSTFIKEHYGSQTCWRKCFVTPRYSIWRVLSTEMNVECDEVLFSDAVHEPRTETTASIETQLLR